MNLKGLNKKVSNKIKDSTNTSKFKKDLESLIEEYKVADLDATISGESDNSLSVKIKLPDESDFIMKAIALANENNYQLDSERAIAGYNYLDFVAKDKIEDTKNTSAFKKGLDALIEESKVLIDFIATVQEETPNSVLLRVKLLDFEDFLQSVNKIAKDSGYHLDSDYEVGDWHYYEFVENSEPPVADAFVERIVNGKPVKVKELKNSEEAQKFLNENKGYSAIDEENGKIYVALNVEDK